MKEVMTTQEAALLLNHALQLRNAQFFRNTKDNPVSVFPITLDLTTAKHVNSPFIVGFPFKSFYVAHATDTNVVVEMKVNSNDEQQGKFPIRKNDAWASDSFVNKGFLSWEAQSGKSITIVFFLDSNFQSGSQISVTGGGVSIVDGSTISIPAKVTLAAGVAGQIAPALSTRKVATIENTSGADIYIGGATVNGTTVRGIRVPADGIVKWQNTGALYAWSAAGGDVWRAEEE